MADAAAEESTLARDHPHRDLKPKNLFTRLLQQAPLVKVLDFGISKVMAQRGAITVDQDERRDGVAQSARRPTIRLVTQRSTSARTSGRRRHLAQPWRGIDVPFQAGDGPSALLDGTEHAGAARHHSPRSADRGHAWICRALPRERSAAHFPNVVPSPRSRKMASAVPRPMAITGAAFVSPMVLSSAAVMAAIAGHVYASRPKSRAYQRVVAIAMPVVVIESRRRSHGSTSRA